MGPITKAKKTFSDYEPIYWVVITLELLERGAYYGIMGYFPVHLIENLGFSGTVYGILYAILVALLYIVPIVASSLAKKFGYKVILTVAFIMVIPAYISMTFMTGPLAFFPAVIAWGVGAGAFKPMVSATIAHVTKKEQRNSAYSIYYLSINWGSLIAMVSIGLLIPQHFAQIVFIVGAVLITLNLLITIFFYKNPVERKPDERIFDSIKNMFLVLSDGKFALLLLIYSGFFFVFSSMHTFLPVYYTGFGFKPAGWVEAPLITAINPATIVILGPFLSKFADRFESLKLMVVGMLIFSGGLFLLGFIPAWYTIAIGIFIFSTGEFLTHPNFISYVSKIAPEEKVALYMGYAFLPSAVGQVGGSIFGGVMWDLIAVGQESPTFFWLIYVGIGVFTMGNFIIYNMFFGPKKAELRRTFWTSKITPVGIYGVAIMLVVVGSTTGTIDYVADEMEDGESDGFLYRENSVQLSDTGSVTEGSDVSFTFNIVEKNIRFVNVSLTWQDEPDQGGLRNFQNQPDTFSVTLSMGNITDEPQGSGTNQQGGSGSIAISHAFQGTPEYTNGTGEYEVTITLAEAGNQVSRFGFFSIEDNSNEYSLTVDYTYLSKIERID